AGPLCGADKGIAAGSRSLATWHTINAVYAQKAQLALKSMRYDIVDPTGIDRLFKLIDQKAGHWLAMQIEDSKIELTQVERRSLSLERIEPGLVAELSQVLLEEAIGPLLARIGASVEQLLGQAGL